MLKLLGLNICKCPIQLYAWDSVMSTRDWDCKCGWLCYVRDIDIGASDLSTPESRSMAIMTAVTQRELYFDRIRPGETAIVTDVCEHCDVVIAGRSIKIVQFKNELAVDETGRCAPPYVCHCGHTSSARVVYF